MATSLKISEKEGRIDHLPFNTYHTVQRLWKSVQRILRYFGSERASPVRNKIGCHGNVPWDIEKKFRSIIYTQKAFIWCKNCKNRTRFVFCLRHKIGCHGNVPWGIWKKWTWSRKFTQIPSIWWKFRENRSSRYWDSFAPSKKKKKLRKVKYIARSASLPCGLNNEQLIVYVLCARLVPPSGDSECTRHLVTYIHSRKGSFSSYDLELWTSQWNLTWSRYGEDEPACQLSIRWNICSDTNDETQTHTPNRFL